MTTFISLAVSATMFPTEGAILISEATPEEVEHIIKANKGLVSALNPSHADTIGVIKTRFGLELPIPDQAPKVVLYPGDTLIVIQANLPRLKQGETHSEETIQTATIRFHRWTVVPAERVKPAAS